MKHIIMINFREDAEPEAIDGFVKQAERSLALARFRSIEFGRGEKVFGDASMDWGYIADVESAADIHEWAACEAHTEMTNALTPILGSVATMSLPASG